MKRGNKELHFEISKDFYIKSDDTLVFFTDLYNELNKECSPVGKIIIDFSKVENLKIAALMYLIAIIRDSRYSETTKRLKIEYRPPIISTAMEQYKMSKFPQIRNVTAGQVKNGKKWLPLNNKNDLDSSGILYGNKVNCHFIDRVLNTASSYGLKNSEALYAILVELMANSIEHGFIKKRGTTIKNTQSWYFYCEKSSTKEALNFLLLDIGTGIPSTAHKHLTEHIERKMQKTGVDTHIIDEALNKSGRSRHKNNNRGKGLPQIAVEFKSDEFSNIAIYSNKGFSDIEETSQKEKRNFIRELFNTDIEDLINWALDFEGTLFAWSMNFPKGEK